MLCHFSAEVGEREEERGVCSQRERGGGEKDEGRKSEGGRG